MKYARFQPLAKTIVAFTFLLLYGCSLLPNYIETIPSDVPLIDCSANQVVHSKKVGVLQFGTPSQNYWIQLPGLGEQMTEAYLTALQEKGHFIVRDLRGLSLGSGAVTLMGHKANTPQDQLIRLADAEDVQLILSPSFQKFLPQHQEGITSLLNQPKIQITSVIKVFEGVTGSLVKELQQQYIWHGDGNSPPELLQSRGVFGTHFEQILS
ncbi:MAG: hypothetical protein HQL48_11885, partial [Gammaproteobacteria bacterium]|nr:hypothetical protein [Gammaproteobacteria bacterium]